MNYTNSDEMKYVLGADGLYSVVVDFKKIKKPLQQFFENSFASLCEKGMDDYDTSPHSRLKKIKESMSRYIETKWWESKQGIYFFSEEAGSGKTLLACIVMNEIFEKYSVSTQAITMIEIFNKITETFNNELVSIESVTNPLKAVDILLIDDIGVEKHSEFREESLYDIINHRMMNNKTTIFTSNKTLDQLPYENRIKSRIKSMVVQIQMPEIDLRSTFKPKF